MLMVFSSFHISIVTEKLSTAAFNPAGARSCDRASHLSGTVEHHQPPDNLVGAPAGIPAHIEDCVVPGVITHTKSTSNAMTNGPELEKAEPSRRVSGGPCTMKAQDILIYIYINDGNQIVDGEKNQVQKSKGKEKV